MKVFLDTNILIDVLSENEKFFAKSNEVVQLGLDCRIETVMSAGAVTDVYYILRKFLRDAVEAREKIFLLSNFVKIVKSTAEDITNAVILFIPDFEDAVIAAMARREKADYIITRNEADFAGSPVPAVSPADFIKQFFPR